MTKIGDLNWEELFKTDEPTPNLQKTHTEKVPSAQYHQDKPVGPLHKNAYSGTEEKDQVPAAPKNKPGEVPRRPTNIEVSQAIMANMPKQMRQPTTAEQIEWAKAAGLIKSAEQEEVLQKDWEGRLNDFYKAASEPVDQQNYDNESGWGSGGSFNDGISAEELEKRNKFNSGNENE